MDTPRRLIAVMLALGILLATQILAFGATAAETKPNPAPVGAIVIAIICYSARKKPIGGWLLYYYISLYTGLALSLLLLATTLQNYSPERWRSAELYTLAIASTTFQQLLLIIQAVVATILLKCREWKWVKVLRTILIGSLIWSAISIALDSAFFSQGYAILDCLTFAWLAIWLAYFFRSNRVKRVFFSKDFGLANTSPQFFKGAPVTTATSPPVQSPSLAPNTGPANLGASKPDNVFPQKTKRPGLIFSLCALIFCAVVILFFRPWEKDQVLQPFAPEIRKAVVPEVRKAIPVRNEATVDFSALSEKC